MRYLFCSYNDVMMSAMGSPITVASIVYSAICSGADQRLKHESSASLAFVSGIHRWPVNAPHNGPVLFPFDDFIMAKFMKTIPYTITFQNIN